MFNKGLKSEIQNLKDRLEVVETKIRRLESKPLEYFKMGDATPDDSILGLYGQYIKAIRDYLKIDFKARWEDDPLPPYRSPKRETIQTKIRVIRAEKIKKVE